MGVILVVLVEQVMLIVIKMLMLQALIMVEEVVKVIQVIMVEVVVEAAANGPVTSKENVLHGLVALYK